MSVVAGKYTEIATIGQTRRRELGGPASSWRSAPLRAASLAAIACLLSLSVLAGCSRRAPNALGPLGASGALSTHSVQPAPTGATEGGQVGFFLDVSGTVTVHQPGGAAGRPAAGESSVGAANPPTPGERGGARGGASGEGGPGAAEEASVPLPPRIGDPIYAPDEIRTGDGSTAQIQLGDNALVRLDPASAIEIPPFPRIAPGSKPPALVVLVQRGTVLFSVAPQSPGSALLATANGFVVESRSADFLIARGSAGSEVAVGRGEVRIGSRLAGERASNGSGRPAQAVTAEEIIEAGVGPEPIGLGAGRQLSIPQAATPGALSALSPAPLSEANRARLLPSERGSTAQEQLMQPQGGAEREPTPPAPPREPTPPTM